MKHLFLLTSLLVTGILCAQRIVLPLNDGWQFSKDATVSEKWQTVNLPHTWNADDVLDDVPGYYRGVAWYKKKLVLSKSLQGKRLFLFFEGANQEATVFINGKKAGAHSGGYTAFSIDITSLLDWNKENEVLVKVDNSYNANIPPLSADFTFYGGIYRHISLVAVDPVHFTFDEYGSKSVFISTPIVNSKKAEVNIKYALTNTAKKKVKVVTAIYDANGKKLVETSTQSVSVAQPHLWSTDDPYLYKAVTKIIDEGTGKVLDEISNPVGLRWFYFDPEKGFLLNGKPCKLVGTSRHQDYKGLGNAVPADLAKKDVGLLKKMGGNFLRVAHYPQDPAVLQACDSLGILASVEIPIVNEITESDSFYNNCLNMQTEMIKQNYNHPSIIIWCYMNEVLLRLHYANDKEKQKTYYANIARLAASLDSITRREDPSRYTMIAYHGDYKKYRDIGLVDIPMIAGWNLYSGWYGATLADFPVFLESFHKDYPAKPMVISEYGADADPRIRSNDPVRFDKSIEYTTKFHQYYLTEMLKRPFVAAAMIWNLADFNSETRIESMPHMNNKGLLTWDRVPKDPYYYYQAMLLRTPFMKILGTQPSQGVADSNCTSYLKNLQVASNMKTIELAINGKWIGKQDVINGLCEWKVPFINGKNNIEVRSAINGKIYSDKADVEFCLQPYRFDDSSNPFHQMNILLGANRFFTDEENRVWIPDQEYHDGSWGHIGGRPFKAAANNRLPYGTDKNITGTNDDPVYQTQQTGIEKYKLDLPPGEYELTFHFAELAELQTKESIYNLTAAESGERIFNVYVNGKLLLDNFNIAAQFGVAAAVVKKTKLVVKDNKGIEIYFKAIEGEPVLNALQVKKIIDTRE